MKTSAKLSLILGSLLSVSAMANHGNSRSSYYDYAEVSHVDPVIERVAVSTPRQECHYESHVVRDRGHQSTTPALLGAIIGGTVANQVSKRSNRNAMTVVGTLLGGTIGNDIGHSNSRGGYHTERRRQCNEVYETHHIEKVVGYNVTYDYDGRTYTTQMKYQPGDKIRVRIGVSPIEEAHLAEY